MYKFKYKQQKHSDRLPQIYAMQTGPQHRLNASILSVLCFKYHATAVSTGCSEVV